MLPTPGMEKKLKILPAFLRGPAATYFHAMDNDKKDSYEKLTKRLTNVWCPAVDREKFFSDFEQRLLRPNEDPALLLILSYRLVKKSANSAQLLNPIANDNLECSSFTNMDMTCSTCSVIDIQSDLENALSPSLSPLERRTLLKKLMQYSDVFDPGLGHTTVITHKIDIGDAAPVCQYPRHLPYGYREETDKKSLRCCNRG